MISIRIDHMSVIDDNDDVQPDDQHGDHNDDQLGDRDDDW